MDDPPPSYNEVLADPLQGRAVFLKPPQQRAPPLSPWELQGRDPELALQSGSSKPPAPSAEHGYCSLIQLPSARHWDGLGQLLSNMDHRGLLPETRTQSEFLGFSRVIGMPGFRSCTRFRRGMDWTLAVASAGGTPCWVEVQLFEGIPPHRYNRL